MSDSEEEPAGPARQPGGSEPDSEASDPEVFLSPPAWRPRKAAAKDGKEPELAPKHKPGDKPNGQHGSRGMPDPPEEMQQSSRERKRTQRYDDAAQVAADKKAASMFEGSTRASARLASRRLSPTSTAARSAATSRPCRRAFADHFRAPTATTSPFCRISLSRVRAGSRCSSASAAAPVSTSSMCPLSQMSVARSTYIRPLWTRTQKSLPHSLADNRCITLHYYITLKSSVCCVKYTHTMYRLSHSTRNMTQR